MTYNYPITAPVAKEGVKIPPGTGQLKVNAVQNIFCIRNTRSIESYNAHSLLPIV